MNFSSSKPISSNASWTVKLRFVNTCPTKTSSYMILTFILSSPFNFMFARFYATGQGVLVYFYFYSLLCIVYNNDDVCDFFIVFVVNFIVRSEERRVGNE